MIRAAVPLFTQCRLFYSLIGLTFLITFISLGKCDEEIRYEPTDCKNESIYENKCSGSESHTFTEKFFIKCQKSLENYDLKLSPGPFNPENACLIFEDLDNMELCIDISEYKDAFVAGLVFLILIVILDVVGVGIILFTVIRDCIKPAPPPPPPPPTPSQQPVSQPTVVIVQTAGPSAAPTTDTPTKALARDEEKGT